MMRAWLLMALVAALASGCAEPYDGSSGASDSTTLPATTSLAEPSSTVTTVSVASSTTVATTTSEVPGTTTTSLRDPGDLSSWVGAEFSVTADHPWASGQEILANVEHFPVQFRVEDEPVDVFGWYVGGVSNARLGPSFAVVVVDREPNPFGPTEGDQHEERPPFDPEPGVSRNLTVWAIDELGPTRYLITDAMEIELPAVLLSYGALVSVTQDPWMCDVEPALTPHVGSGSGGIDRDKMLFAFFDSTNYEELEIEALYPSVLAFAYTNGQLDAVPPESVRCIVRFDPENY